MAPRCLPHPPSVKLITADSGDRTFLAARAREFGGEDIPSLPSLAGNGPVNDVVFIPYKAATAVLAHPPMDDEH